MDERIKKPNRKQLVGAPNMLSYVLDLKVPTVPKKQYQSGGGRLAKHIPKS